MTDLGQKTYEIFQKELELLFMGGPPNWDRLKETSPSKASAFAAIELHYTQRIEELEDEVKYLREAMVASFNIFIKDHSFNAEKLKDHVADTFNELGVPFDK